MNAKRITELLSTLSEDFDFDTSNPEQGCMEDSVVLRSDDERTEVVLRFEAEEWEIRYEHRDEPVNLVIQLAGEGFGSDTDVGGDLTDALGLIENFTADIGV